MRPSSATTAKIATTAFGILAVWTAASASTTVTTNVNAAANEPAVTGTGLLVNAAAAELNIPVNGPAADAAVAAKATAQNPEMQKAVGSFWAIAWHAAWPFLRSLPGRLLNLILSAWHSRSTPATNANVSANANVDASTNAPVPTPNP